ncbi:MAG TPA: hypothetical protein VGS22_30505 [Thermoanaerobaculia bacterium]|jgi:hypothetical protein|nr:hypothetical protein [Thermoanaerobaculia bacterium]
MKRALPLALLTALLILGISAAGHATTVEIAPGFLATVDSVPTVPGAEAKPADLGDLFSPSRSLSCANCTEARKECRLLCAEALCTVGFFSCNPSNPCGYVCSCFCL